MKISQYAPYAIFQASSECLLKVSHYSPRRGIVDKFTKSSKIVFSTECFTTDFLQFSSTNVKIGRLGGRLGALHQIQAFKRFSLNFQIS